MTQVDCLKAFSHVVEDVSLLFGRLSLIHGEHASDDPCLIYALLTFPLHSLQITHGRTSDA
jgi:hypothetical protein